jgi:hypothetical protein
MAIRVRLAGKMKVPIKAHIAKDQAAKAHGDKEEPQNRGDTGCGGSIATRRH